jgi:hypothetical protein
VHARKSSLLETVEILLSSARPTVREVVVVAEDFVEAGTEDLERIGVEKQSSGRISLSGVRGTSCQREVHRGILG